MSSGQVCVADEAAVRYMAWTLMSGYIGYETEEEREELMTTSK